MKRFLRNAVFVIIGLLFIIQFIPVQRNNPPITQEVKWGFFANAALGPTSLF